MTVVEKYVGTATALPGRGTPWQNPTNAEGVEDDSCSHCTSPGYTMGLLMEEFEFVIPSNAIIDEVLLIVKAGVTDAVSEMLQFLVYDGSEWSNYIGSLNDEIVACSDTIFWCIDINSVLDTATKINNCKIRCNYIPSGGGGDYPMYPYTGYLDALKIKVTYHVPSAVKPHSGTLLSPGIFSLPNQHLRKLDAKLKLCLMLRL